jgi:hypothetical protein
VPGPFFPGINRSRGVGIPTAIHQSAKGCASHGPPREKSLIKQIASEITASADDDECATWSAAAAHGPDIFKLKKCTVPGWTIRPFKCFAPQGNLLFSCSVVRSLGRMAITADRFKYLMDLRLRPQVK